MSPAGATPPSEKLQLPPREGPLAPPSRVRYQVLAVVCCLALLTYVHRLGFVVGNNDIKSGLGLDKEQMGYLASAFLVAYAVFQVPGGLLGDWWGGRHTLTILVLVWSLLTGAVALTALLPAAPVPLSAASAVGLGASPGGTGPFAVIAALITGRAPLLTFLVLLGLRFLFGMFQAGGFPTLARVLADWMPLTERASAQGMTWTFSRLGGAFVPFLFLWLFQFFGTWTTPFWIMAGLGILWAALFWPWFRNRPEEMRGVNSAERSLIASGRVNARRPGPVPLLAMLCSVSVWSLSLMYGFVGFAGNFITNLLPLYLGQERHLTRAETMQLSAVPLACGAVSCVLGGLLSDWCVRRWCSRKWGRRVVAMVGVACAGLTLLLTLWVEELWLLALLLGASFFFNDLMMGPAWAACADIGERYAGTLSGTMNMLGSLAGAAGTAFAGYQFERGHDRLVFVIFACSYGLAALCWLGVNAAKPLVAKPAPPTPEDKDLVATPCVEV